jgi:hypothetical protein
LANFSKEFYHWLAGFDNEAQRVCVRLVANISNKVSKKDQQFVVINVSDGKC